MSNWGAYLIALGIAAAGYLIADAIRHPGPIHIEQAMTIRFASEEKHGPR